MDNDFRVVAAWQKAEPELSDVLRNACLEGLGIDEAIKKVIQEAFQKGFDAGYDWKQKA